MHLSKCKAPLPHIRAEVGEGTMKHLHFVKNERRDCILVSCNMYNDKSPLPGGRLMVDSPTILHPQPVYVVVGLYIDRCISIKCNKFRVL